MTPTRRTLPERTVGAPALKRMAKRFVRFYPTTKMARCVGSATTPAPTQETTGVMRLDWEGIGFLESRYPHVSAVPMHERLMAGDACYAIPAGGPDGVEAFVWVVSGRSFYVPEIAADVWVPQDVSYFYEAFTFPSSRGRGLMSTLLLGTVAALADERPPDHRCEAWVARRNRASSRAFEKAGFRPYESFLFASVGPVHLSVGRPWLREGRL